MLLLSGCSCNQDIDVDSQLPPPAPALLPNLAPNDWVLMDWAAKDLDHPLPPVDAELVSVDQALKISTYERIGPVHVLLRRELSDEFELTARIIQPGVEERREEGMPNPSKSPCLIGFRSSNGQTNLRTHLQRGLAERETLEIVMRGSAQQLIFSINGKKSQIMSRPRSATGHVFLEMPKNQQLYLVDVSIREGLEPDPELVKAAERQKRQPVVANRETPPPGFLGPGSSGFGPGFGPGFPGFGPGFPGMGSPGMAGPPPAPSLLEPLASTQDWSVPKLGIPNLDTVISHDLRLESIEGGVTLAKTSASGGVWLISKLQHEGDFTAAYRVSIPSMRELASVAGPATLLAVGMYSSAEDQPGVVTPAPSPAMSETRDFDFSVRRVNGRATLDVAGTPLGGSVTTTGEILVGLYVRGGLRFSVFDVTLPTEPAGSLAETTKPPKLASTKPAPTEPAPAEPAPTATQPLANRVWTDTSGSRQVEATFLKLVGTTAHFRRDDGTEVTIPLTGLCRADQLLIRKMASP